MNLINYTRIYGFGSWMSNQWNNVKQSFKPTSQVTGAKYTQGPTRETFWRGDKVTSHTWTAPNGRSTSWDIKHTSDSNKNPYKVGTLTSGGISDRLAWNTGGASKALGGNANLAFKSKAKIAAWGVGTGLAAGKIGSSIAENKARTSAIKAGLKPGTPEYNRYVSHKASAGKWIGRGVGLAAGLAGSRYLGKNSFKLK